MYLVSKCIRRNLPKELAQLARPIRTLNVHRANIDEDIRNQSESGNGIKTLDLRISSKAQQSSVLARILKYD
ncbi:hypothetical protein QR98_0041560 [Sarcoptes scabiei]|uniref:Uncharacterized protein n=1 Tax=Sarcoptes scabiei TaxID=52283 RepID=A0A132A3X2_SARSC|nr:hypothetical protein QR98_0041560 [Sarcoptes scabiei]